MDSSKYEESLVSASRPMGDGDMSMRGEGFFSLPGQLGVWGRSPQHEASAVRREAECSQPHNKEEEIIAKVRPGSGIKSLDANLSNSGIVRESTNTWSRGHEGQNDSIFCEICMSKTCLGNDQGNGLYEYICENCGYLFFVQYEV